MTDAVLIDVDADGRYDGARLDTNEDRNFDVELVLENEVVSIWPWYVQFEEQDRHYRGDGVIDERIFLIDLDGDLIHELALVDRGLDGIVDRIGINPDDDGVWWWYHSSGELESVEENLVVCMPESERLRYEQHSKYLVDLVWGEGGVRPALSQEPPDFQTAIEALRSMMSTNRVVKSEFRHYLALVERYEQIDAALQEALDSLEEAAEIFLVPERREDFISSWESFWKSFGKASALYHLVICRTQEVPPAPWVPEGARLYATGAGTLVPHTAKGIDQFLGPEEVPGNQPYGLVLCDVTDWVAYHVISEGPVSRIRLCLANPEAPEAGTRVSVYFHRDPVPPPDNVKPPCHDTDPASLVGGCTEQPVWEKLGTVSIHPPGDWRIYSLRFGQPLGRGGYLIIIRLDEPSEEIQEGRNEVRIAWLQLIIEE